MYLPGFSVLHVACTSGVLHAGYYNVSLKLLCLRHAPFLVLYIRIIYTQGHKAEHHRYILIGYAFFNIVVTFFFILRNT